LPLSKPIPPQLAAEQECFSIMNELIAEANQQPTIKQPIIEHAIYDRRDAVNVTGFSLSTLIRSEEKGKLKGRSQGRRRYYLGKDLLAYLAGGDDE
jgi:hypothetical protein